MQVQELTLQEMNETNGGTLCLVGSLLNALTNGCNDNCCDNGGIKVSIKVKLSLGFC